jgi:hypothetical protein
VLSAAGDDREVLVVVEDVEESASTAAPAPEFADLGSGGGAGELSGLLDPWS